MSHKQPPKRIFLQRNDDDNADWVDAFWCEDSINDGDVEYIRADLACPRSSLASTPDLDREVLRKAVVNLQGEALAKKNNAYTDASEASWSGEIDMAEKVLDLIDKLLPPAAPSEGKEKGPGRKCWAYFYTTEGAPATPVYWSMEAPKEIQDERGIWALMVEAHGEKGKEE